MLMRSAYRAAPPLYPGLFSRSLAPHP